MPYLYTVALLITKQLSIQTNSGKIGVSKYDSEIVKFEIVVFQQSLWVSDWYQLEKKSLVTQDREKIDNGIFFCNKIVCK